MLEREAHFFVKQLPPKALLLLYPSTERHLNVAVRSIFCVCLNLDLIFVPTEGYLMHSNDVVGPFIRFTS